MKPAFGGKKGGGRVAARPRVGLGETGGEIYARAAAGRKPQKYFYEEAGKG